METSTNEGGAAGVPIEELLREADWVRALARRLVGETEADDVVQESWLAALRRPPRDRGAARGWLARVVRNAAASRRRTGAARVAREQEADRGDARAPAPEEELARLETQERLLRLVRELPEGERQVVQLACLEGWSSEEVGARLGLSAGGARWRLKRALERLRERLDAESGGDRREWLAALAPLAVPARPAAPAAAGLGVWLLASPAVAVVAVTLVVAAALVWLVPWSVGTAADAERDATSAHVEAAGGAQPAAASPTPGGLAPTQPRTPLVAADADEARAADAPTRIVGRVVDADGRAVAGARVSATPDLALARATEPALEALGPLQRMSALAGLRAVSDDDGGFELHSELVSQAGVVLLDVDGPRFERWEGDVEVNPGETSTLPDVVLEPAGAIGGLVRAAGGEGVRTWLGLQALGERPDTAAEAALRAVAPDEPPGMERLISSQAGTFEERGLSPGHYLVWARAVELERWTPFELVQVRAGERVELSLLLAPVAAASLPVVEVRGADGDPLPSAVVTLRAPRLASEGDVDADGRYDARIFAGQRVELTVADREHRHRPRTLVAEELAGTLVVRLEAADVRPRTVRVVGRDGELVDGANVVQELDGLARIVPREAGGYELRLRADAAAELHVRATGYRTRTFSALRPDEVPADWVVALEPLPRILGKVTRDGRPVADAEVRLSAAVGAAEVQGIGERVSRVRWYTGHDARSDAAGRFVLDHPEHGRWCLRVRAPGSADWTSWVEPLAEGEAEDVVLAVELVAPATVEGVLRGPDGAPQVGQAVLAARADHEGKLVRTDRDGRFRLTGLAPGGWAVRPLDPSRGRTGNWVESVPAAWRFPVDVELASGEVRALDLAPPTHAGVRLTLDVVGLAADAPLALHATRAVDTDPFAWRWSDRVEGRAGAPLHVSLPEPGVYSLSVTSPTFDGSVHRRVTVDATGASLSLALDAPATPDPAVLAPLLVPSASSRLSAEVGAWTYAWDDAPATGDRWRVPARTLTLELLLPDAPSRLHTLRLESGGRTLLDPP